MKFNFLRVMALVLVAVMCLSLFACNNSGNDGNVNGNGNENVPPSAKDENQLFAELKAAYLSSLSHTDAMTIAGKQTQTRAFPGQDAQTMEMVAKISADFANAKCFMTTNQSYNGSEYTEQMKVLTVGDALYLYSASASGENINESFVKYNLADVKSSFAAADADMLNESLEEGIGGTFIADSYDELKAAFANTYPKLLENQINYDSDAYKFAEGAEITLTPDVSIYEKDGEIVLTIITTFTAEGMHESETELMKNAIGTMARTYKAKDGKLSCFIVSLAANYDYEVNGEEIGKVEQDMALEYDISYTFDEAGYNAMEVTLPEDPSAIEEYVSSKEIKFVVGSSTRGYVWSNEYESVGEILAAGAAAVEERFDTRYDPETEESVKLVTVKGFYKDAALTEKIDESMTMEGLLALDYVYADVEVAEGYALVDYTTKKDDQTSRDYQIVYSGSFYGYSAEMSGMGIQQAGNPVTFSYTPEGTRDYKVLVNGVETDADSFIPESGKVYVVTYVEITQDKDLGITHVFAM